MHFKLESITKSFNDHVVLREITLELSKLQALVLIGPSGGGKSTLLRILGGLTDPDGGKVWIGSAERPNDEPELRNYRAHIGTVFQSFNLFWHLSALQNITLPMTHVHGRRQDQATEEAIRLLERFQLANHAHKKPAELSGGQRQRVAILRAIAVQPDIFLFDEPTSALDPEMTAEVLDIIAELRAEEKPFILATHQIAFARRIADHVVFLAAGRIVEHGPAEPFFQQTKTQTCRCFLQTVLKY